MPELPMKEREKMNRQKCRVKTKSDGVGGGRGGGRGGSSEDVVRMGEDEGMEQHRRRDGATEVFFLTDS